MTNPAERQTASIPRPALAGAAATLSGIGLSRFAYVPLFPAMVEAGWVSGTQAGFLGAVNLAGYLIGVVSGRATARRFGVGHALDIGMGLAVLSFSACAWNGGVAWLAGWRLCAGIAGGLLMAIAGPAVQATVLPGARGAAGGIVVSGVGTGIIVASLVLPLLLPAGVSAAWLGFAAIVLSLWIAARPLWPDAQPLEDYGPSRPTRAWPLLVSYALAGAGMVPHMVYFADLAVHGRGLDPLYGAALWLLFGVGAVSGTLTAGMAADRWGGATALWLWFLIQAVGLAAALPSCVALLAVSAFLGGFGGIGVTAIALARARELAGAAAADVWVRVTASFAVSQAATGFALTALFGRTHSHEALFATGLALSIAALPVAILGARRPAVAV